MKPTGPKPGLGPDLACGWRKARALWPHVTVVIVNFGRPGDPAPLPRPAGSLSSRVTSRQSSRLQHCMPLRGVSAGGPASSSPCPEKLKASQETCPAPWRPQPGVSSHPPPPSPREPTVSHAGALTRTHADRDTPSPAGVAWEGGGSTSNPRPLQGHPEKHLLLLPSPSSL